MKIEFIGALTGVTGSMTLVSNSMGQILIDSGLFQGLKEVVRHNKDPLPFDPKDIDAIILTHAHLDHSGFIPRLVKLGFRGFIYCTKPTMKLAKIIMLDSAKIMAGKEQYMHSFYELEDVAVVTSLFKVKNFHSPFDVLGMSLEFIRAGHILGAASVVIRGEKTVIFSGDLGRENDPLMNAAEPCPDADIIVMESTYGDRSRHGIIEEELQKFLKHIKHESKVGIIASFAVARGQLLISMIHQYFADHPEEKIRVVIDGPMMVEANKIYREFSDETKIPNLLRNALNDIEIIDNESEWDSLQKKDGPLIIISSSGMITGGRIWRHLENWQSDPNACLFLPGYQAEGTAGRMLAESSRVILNEKRKINWRGEVITSEAFSSHADQNELIAWLKNVSKEAHIFLNHGELDGKLVLQKKLNQLGFKSVEIAKISGI